MLAHNVFFTLTDPTPANAEKLVAACKKYLTGHPGAVFFAAGVLCTELRRPVNDLEFDVALHLVFQTKADQDAYQISARHVEFVDVNKPLWKKARVFDSLVTGA